VDHRHRGRIGVGVAVTDDVDALLALQADYVVYMPPRPDVAMIERILRAGSNVVTTAPCTARPVRGRPTDSAVRPTPTR
jgi:hypothetical protein